MCSSDLARVAQTVVPEAPRRKTSVALATAQDRLRVARVRDRLGARTADALARLWDEHDAELDDGEEPVLVHGDFSGRNILVRVERDRCVVAGLIDWELAFPRQRAVGPGEPLRLRGPLPAGVHRGLRAWPRRAPARLVAAGPPPQRHAARRQLALAKAGPGVVADSREKLVGVVAEWP